jgi:hypothetical protein
LIRRLGLSALLALLAIGVQASAVFASANEEHGNCIAQFTSNQAPGEVAATISVLAREAHPFGVNVVSFTAVNFDPPCGEEE